MAATKRALAIAKRKQELVVAIGEIRVAIRNACNKVPQRIINGSATDAVGWRTLAESNFNIDPLISLSANSLTDLEKIEQRDRDVLNRLT